MRIATKTKTRSSLTSPADFLENIIKLCWSREPVNSLLDYCEIVWREMSSQQVSLW